MHLPCLEEKKRFIIDKHPLIGDEVNTFYCNCYLVLPKVWWSPLFYSG